MFIVRNSIQSRLRILFWSENKYLDVCKYKYLLWIMCALTLDNDDKRIKITWYRAWQVFGINGFFKSMQSHFLDYNENIIWLLGNFLIQCWFDSHYLCYRFSNTIFQRIKKTSFDYSKLIYYIIYKIFKIVNF